MKKIVLGLSVVALSTLFAADGAAVYKEKCFSCHGEKAVKPALNKSVVIAGWDAAKTIASMNGYKNDVGGPMKAIMKPIVSGMNDDEIAAVAATIPSFK